MQYKYLIIKNIIFKIVNIKENLFAYNFQIN